MACIAGPLRGTQEAPSEAVLVCILILSEKMFRSFLLTAGLTPEGQEVAPMADPRCGSQEAPFEAVLVFTDPVDWYRDLQLLTDVIMSGQLVCP